MTMPSAQLPLGGRQQALAGGEIRELPWCGKSILRCDPSNPTIQEQLQQTGLSLPDKANTVNRFEVGQVIWMGPDEWLLRADSDPTDQGWLTWQTRLEEYLQQSHIALVDVSDYYTVFELTGEHASDILARGCPLDFAAIATKENVCAQSRIGNAPVLLLPLSSNSTDVRNFDGWSIQVLSLIHISEPTRPY